MIFDPIIDNVNISEKNVKSKILLLDILGKIDKGYMTSEIWRMLGWKRQLLYYYIRKLKKLGLIELEYRTHGGAKYKLTPKGKNFYIRYVSSLKGYIRLHHYQLKYPIYKIGNLQYDKTWQSNGVTWFYKYWNKHYSIKWNDRYLHVMIKDLKKDSAVELLNQARNEANQIVEELNKNFGFEIDVNKCEVVRKPHFAIITPHTYILSKEISETLKTEIQTENAKIDESEGFGEYEIVGNKEDKLDEICELADATLNFPKKLLNLERKFSEIEKDWSVVRNDLIPAISELAKQIKLHLEVMNEMKETLKEIRESLKEMRK